MPRDCWSTNCSPSTVTICGCSCDTKGAEGLAIDGADGEGGITNRAEEATSNANAAGGAREAGAVLVSKFIAS